MGAKIRGMEDALGTSVRPDPATPASTAPAGAGAAIQMRGRLQPRSGWTADRCPILASVAVVGTRSAFAIMREAFYGATRFEQFVNLGQLSEPVVAARLRELTGAGLLATEPYREPGQRTRNAYRLTAKGRELLPVLAALMQWGNRWELGEDATVELAHRDCGAPVEVELRCQAGHRVAADGLELRPREGAAAS
jgi:DNA-binding HxlR family transcriptional regulator